MAQWAKLPQFCFKFHFQTDGWVTDFSRVNFRGHILVTFHGHFCFDFCGHFLNSNAINKVNPKLTQN